MFEFSQEYEFEAVGDDRLNVVIPNPAPRCKLAIRKDTKAWSVATGAFFKRVSTEDGSTFRDGDGGIWRLVAIDPRDERIAAKDAEIEALQTRLTAVEHSVRVGSDVDHERDFLAMEARRYASHYPEASDGRNTFILFAEMIEARAALKGDAA